LTAFRLTAQPIDTSRFDTYGHLLLGAEAEVMDGMAAFFVRRKSDPAELCKTGTDDTPIDEGAA
jgi:hypothetical protein